jgi:CP family cyanate transporter-like MFS transporter
MSIPAASKSTASPVLFAFILFIVGINLRPALSAVAPLLDAIRADGALSATAAGALATLPVLCFGLIAPIGALLARHFSSGRIIFCCLALLAVGQAFRVWFGMPGLFVGTLAVGIAIGIVMVLLPVIFKRDFASSVGFLTGLYTTALSFGAALAAGLAVPLQQAAGGDWRPALALWALPALAAWAAWALAGCRYGRAEQRQAYRVRGLLGSGLAWQVACFMGLQSLLAYCVFAWLPTILIDRGLDALSAGAVLSVSIAAQLPASLAGPWIAGRGNDQRAAVALLLPLMMAGLFGCLHAPLAQVWFWALLLGAGQGGSFTVATMLVVLRAPDEKVVAALSGMTQSIAYLLAACGPFVTGLLRDLSGGWQAPTLFFAGAALAAIGAGLGAGRKLQVRVEVLPLE